MATKKDVLDFIKKLEKELNKKDISTAKRFIKKAQLLFFRDLIKKIR